MGEGRQRDERVGTSRKEEEEKRGRRRDRKEEGQKKRQEGEGEGQESSRASVHAFIQEQRRAQKIRSGRNMSAGGTPPLFWVELVQKWDKRLRLQSTASQNQASWYLGFIF